LIQNSAISFSVCINNKYGRLNELVSHLKNRFKVEVDNNVSLYTIRHFDQKAIEKIKNNGKNILLEQRAQNTIQFITD
jgi:aspartate kinase